ncbi:MAG: hypothetical protein AAGC65_20195, partial [Mucilaginibacter sp.]|uniref:hypothetical protein n=1 Tax=Mucilaginibacter sp. TaxID=1882438 RepID=UPI0031AD9D57
MYSQRRIIIRFFEKHHAFKNGKLIPVDSDKISNEEGRPAAANLDYFVSHYDLAPLQPYFSKDLSMVADSLGKLQSKSDNSTLNRYELQDEKQEWIKKQLAVSKFSARYAVEGKTEKNSFYNVSKQGTLIDSKGYDFIMDPALTKDTIADTISGLAIQHIILQSKATILKINKETLTFNPSTIARKLLTDKAKLNTYLEKNKEVYDNRYTVPATWMWLTAESKSFQVKLILNNLNFNTSANTIDITYVTYMYLIKRK